MANLLWFVFAGLGALTLGGGMVSHGVQWVARLTPSGALTEALTQAMTPSVDWFGIAVLAAWGAVAALARCAGSASPDARRRSARQPYYGAVVIGCSTIGSVPVGRLLAAARRRAAHAEPADAAAASPLAVILTQGGIAVTGAIVRVTASGLGCPTWPQCFPGSFTPVPRRRGAGASTRPSSSATG